MNTSEKLFSTSHSVVVRLPNWVGDVVMATPALRSLRRGYPGSQIYLQGKPKLLELLSGLDSFDDTVPLSSSRGQGLWYAASALRRFRFDTGLLLPNSFSSALIFFLGSVGNRIGYALNGRGCLLHRSLPISARARKKAPQPMTDYYLRIARFAGGAAAGERVELVTEDRMDAAAQAFLRDAGLLAQRPLVGLNIGSSFGPSKCWTAEGFARVSDTIQTQLEGRSLLLCGPGEEEPARAIIARAERPIVDTSRAVMPLSLLKSVIKRLDLLVTTDTGPRHIAVAFGIPVVVLMGPTDLRYTATNLDTSRVIRSPIDCAPCHKKECDREHQCMTNITSEMVLCEVVDLLQRRCVEAP